MNSRDDAIRIWKAGVAAVDSTRLTASQIRLDGDWLVVCGRRFRMSALRRIEVVGAGKAGAGMAAGVEQALASCPSSCQISGWVNVPSDCVRALTRIHLHAARPPGINEPTAAGVAGTAEILRRVQELGPDDLCLTLISGGASALLCQPPPAVSLERKLAVTRALAADGAPIDELNLVRTQLSMVKGGQLAAACRAGTLIALVISDVVGDPLPIIGSGPTVASPSTARDALKVLERRGLLDGRIPAEVTEFLREQALRQAQDVTQGRTSAGPRCEVLNQIIGSTATAMAAAKDEAIDLGYTVIMLGSDNQGEAAEEGRKLFRLMRQMRCRDAAAESPGVATTSDRLCLLSGGEPTVKLAPVSVPRLGGRNQELVLAALAEAPEPEIWRGLTLLSGGTDGEDGPTDAAGAVADASIVRTMRALQLNPSEALRINNSCPILRTLGALLVIGPTHTNVMDLRVGLVTAQDDR